MIHVMAKAMAASAASEKKASALSCERLVCLDVSGWDTVHVISRQRNAPERVRLVARNDAPKPPHEGHLLMPGRGMREGEDKGSCDLRHAYHSAEDPNSKIEREIDQDAREIGGEFFVARHGTDAHE